MQQRSSDPAPVIVVIVTRTGGFAGLRRAWRAEPPVDEASDLIELIEQCPWEAPPGAVPPAQGLRGADRYVWSIQAHGDGLGEREAEVPDAALTGAWRALVDAVRAWTSPDPSRTASAS